MNPDDNTKLLTAIKEQLDRIQRNQVLEVKWWQYVGVALVIMLVGVIYVYRQIGKDFKDQNISNEEWTAKYYFNKDWISKRNRGEDLRFWDRLKVIFFNKDTPKYLLHIVGTHFIVFMFVGGVLLVLFTSLHIDVAALSVLEIFFALIGAYYASLADRSAKQAHEVSQLSYEEAKRTRNAVVHVADSLDMFASKINLELREHKAKGDCISIKFLTVNPAFGHVGMGPEYQRTATDRPFHEFLFDIVHDTTQWNIEILTHDCVRAKDWLHNILSATDMGPKAIQEKVNSLYEEQRLFVEKLADGIEASRIRVRFWEPFKLLNGLDLPKSEEEIRKVKEDMERVKIPFQFFMIKPFEPFKKNGLQMTEKSLPSDPKLLKVFFLFSGDFLYDFVFKILPDEDRVGMNMKKLSSLTKGYYTDDKDLVEIFDNIFESFFSKMPELQPRYSEEFFPQVSWIFQQSSEGLKSKGMIG